MSLHVEQIRLDWKDDSVAEPLAGDAKKPLGAATEATDNTAYWERLESSDDDVSKAVREWLDSVVDRDD